MAKAKLYKANLNWMVVGEHGEKIMGATPEAAQEAFKGLWAQHYPGIECPEIERDEALDIVTSASAPEAAAPEADKAPETTAAPVTASAPKPTLHDAGRPFTMEELHAALVEGERLQKVYAPAFAHPLLQPNVAVEHAQALEAVRSLERGLSATSGREVKLL